MDAMTVPLEHTQSSKHRVKKARNKFLSTGADSVIVAGSSFKGKSVALSHNNLRNLTLQSHSGKSYNSSRAWQMASRRQTHGVELTDDVIIIGQDGRRVPTPGYATLRIDQMPQFSKK